MGEREQGPSLNPYCIFRSTVCKINYPFCPLPLSPMPGHVQLLLGSCLLSRGCQLVHVVQHAVLVPDVAFGPVELGMNLIQLLFQVCCSVPG